MIFSVHKVSEGGMGQKAAIELLKSHGFAARRAHSPYVGQTGVEVDVAQGDYKTIHRIEDILY